MDFENSSAWPIVQAQKIVQKITANPPKKGYVLFETGYGPSGLPHIGTFSEAIRTSMVLNAFRKICDIPAKIICFSDDMDGLRKVPVNLPNQEMMRKYLHHPLSSIPDPFEKEQSFSANMNERLKAFLDKFDFEYEIWTSSHFYKNGLFDTYLIKVLERYDAIMSIMLPTLQNRKETYSPFLPICKMSGKVLEVPTLARDVQNHTITYQDPITQELVTTKVTGGNCKLQWKPDFAMRWAALEVDFEMYGKDVSANGVLYSQICTVLDGTPPVCFHYEHFLGESGEKISKSKGNSIDIDQWLLCAPVESLKLFIYQNPERAKKLHFGVIPKNADDYLALNETYHKQSHHERLTNPVHHIHNGKVPIIQTCGINFTMLINLAAACSVTDATILWNTVKKFSNEKLDPNTGEFLHQLTQKAYLYYKDFVALNKVHLKANDQQKSDLRLLLEHITSIDEPIDPQELQNYIYSIGMQNPSVPLKEYFKQMYQILLGQENGPRLGSLLAILGKEDAKKLIQKHL